ncbi:Uncharacterized protein HZ326_13233 [Fusarium oxysporum f. sp. albedinis]|nr:Uncharacterized protein HZ326_13233 [Fusarium oxysporum f. sp. albedinis]
MHSNNRTKRPRQLSLMVQEEHRSTFRLSACVGAAVATLNSGFPLRSKVFHHHEIASTDLGVAKRSRPLKLMIRLDHLPRTPDPGPQTPDAEAFDGPRSMGCSFTGPSHDSSSEKLQIFLVEVQVDSTASTRELEEALNTISCPTPSGNLQH